MNIDLNKTQQQIEWLKEKIYLDTFAESAKKRVVKRGQVYRCKLGVGIGSEESKERPCVILQYNSANKTSPNTLVAPITHSSSSIPIVVPIETKVDSVGNIILDGNALLGNITCISKARIGNYICELTKSEMKDIDKAISLSLGIDHYYQALQNDYNDKMEYIEKLKEIQTSLQNELIEANMQISQLKYKILS